MTEHAYMFQKQCICTSLFFNHILFVCHCYITWASLVAQLVKNLLAMWETWVWFLGWEDPLEKRMAAHSSILAWRISWTIVHGVGKSWTQLSNFHFHYYLFLLGWALVTAHWIFTCDMWDLVPWPGIEPRLPALGEQSLRQWTIREVVHIFSRWCFCRWLRSPGVHWFFFFEVPISEWDVLLPESIHLEFSEQILMTQCNKRTSSPKSQSSNIFLGVVIGNAPFSSIDINEITYYIQG